MVSHAPNLHQLFARASRRLGVLSVLRGTAAGMGVAALWTARSCIGLDSAQSESSIAILAPIALGAFLGAAVGWWRSARPRARVAFEIEQHAPEARNLLVTAHELIARPRTAMRNAGDDVSTLVVQRADRLAATIDPRVILPATRSVLALGVSLALCVGTVVVSRRDASNPGIPSASALMAAVTGRVDIQRVAVRVTEPRYTRRPPTSLRDPARIDALIGSEVSIAIEATADTIIAVTRQGSQSLARDINGTFTLSLPVTLDGFITLEPRARDGRAGPRRLIGLSVRADQSPRVRIAAPARDLIVPDAKRTLDVRLEADDDLALGSLRLRYTKVSGSGERYTFSEGEVPVAVARTSTTQWTARASLALEPLLQEPGDLVVYRAVVTDARPGSPMVESDAFIAELAAPGGVAALGFALDPNEDRYALSQQMVILKTERMLARRATMTAAALADESAQLAGEQRRVRAEFVFMMGGEFAQEVTGDAGGDLDETHEAESEGDLAAGRMVNRGRTALLSAVRAMSRAAVSLTTSDLTTALASEKVALKQLQEAFARSRFLMRALSQREQLDPARRLTGRLDSTARSSAPIPEGAREASRIAWRAILEDVIATARRASGDGTLNRSRVTSRDATDFASQFTALAERVLQTDAASPRAQRVAAQLAAAGAASTSVPSSPRVRALLDSAAIGLTALQADGLRPAAGVAMPAALRRLQADLEASLREAHNSARRSRRP